MGARAIRRWILYPLRRLDAIERRLDAVEELHAQGGPRAALRETLGRIADVERINARVAAGRASARDLVALRRSLEAVPGILEITASLRAPLFADSLPLDPLPDVASLIAQAIVDDPPTGPRDPGVIRPGHDARLDEWRGIASHGKGWIAELEARERARTGIANLKIRYNRVFGYYIEISKSNLPLAPADYERRQTLANAERFVTPELRGKIEGAPGRRGGAALGRRSSRSGTGAEASGDPRDRGALVA
jgi:DNA mismatch repair protein MutS